MPGPKDTERNIEKVTLTSHGQGSYIGQATTKKAVEGLTWKSATAAQERDPSGFVYRSLADHDGWEHIDAVRKVQDLTKTKGLANVPKFAASKLEEPRRKYKDVTAKEKAAKLIFAFKDYPVAQYFAFTSVEISVLVVRVRNALDTLPAVYEPCHEQGKLFQCQAMSSAESATFAINLLELKPECQQQHGHKYVLEVCRGRCTSPRMWNSLCNSFFLHLGDTVTMPKPCNERSTRGFPLNDGTCSKQGCCEVKSQEPLRISTATGTDSQALIDLFLEIVASAKLPDNCIEYAEAFAELFKRVSVSSVMLNVDENPKAISRQLDRFHHMLCHNEYDVRRCTCTILQTLFQNGMLKGLKVQEKEDLFKSLLRVVNMVGERCMLLMPMQSEALLALKEMSFVFKPEGALADQAKQTFDRCALSENPRVSANASVCLEHFFAWKTCLQSRDGF